jgi:cytochrome c oxidase subunit 2
VPVSLVALLALAAASLAAGCGEVTPSGIVRGEELFENCYPCHGKGGGGNSSLGAPAIAGLPRWYIERQLLNFRSSMRGANPQDIEGARMRPMARALYRPGDVQSVARFVSAMAVNVQGPAEMPGDTAAGRATYQNVCITCHQEDLSGNEALGAPPLTTQPDWYMLTQLYKFKNGMRGAHPDDPMGAQMAAMSQTLADSGAMRDVIAYIRSRQR